MLVLTTACVALVVVSCSQARSHTFGFNAVGAKDSPVAPLQVYVGVPWSLNDSSAHVVRPIAEAIVHEVSAVAFCGCGAPPYGVWRRG